MSEPRTVIVTRRQLDILNEALADGATTIEIGQRLGINHETVRSHLRHIYSRAMVNDRQQLVVDYFRGRLRFQLKGESQ